MSRQEREALSLEIQQENEMVRRLGAWVRGGAIATLVFGLLTYWGWSGMIDPLLPKIPMSVRNVIKWIAVVALVISAIFTVLCFLSHRNGKKSVIKKIDNFKNNK
ncbi:MAG: hypothetical protein HUJ53_09750 [Holdemanella sp.]|nr:hypothetical protein [Holdemanella sp.]